MKILWLASWYPNTLSPYEGDFIQRHARAVASLTQLAVIHVYQTGIGGAINKDSVNVCEYDNLKEVSVSFKYIKTGVKIIDKFLYNHRYYSVYKKLLKRYFKENGLPQLVHVHVPIKAGVIALWIKRKYDIPLVVTEHLGIYNDIVSPNYSHKSRFFKKNTKRIFKGADKFTSVSKFLAEGVNQLVTKKNYNIIPNAVDTSFFNLKNKKTEVFRFIHVSNMVGLKNVEGILRAFRALCEQECAIELIMVGNASPLFHNYVIEAGLQKKIVFRGEVPYKQVAAEMQDANCLVLFSNIENSPCVVGEALCCGLPVIATNVGGIPELLATWNSILVEPANEIQLIEAMNKMKNDYSKFNRKRIAEEAQRKYSYATIGKQFLDLYKEILTNY